MANFEQQELVYSPLARPKGFEPMAVVGLVITLLLHGGAIGGAFWYRHAKAQADKNVAPAGKYVVAKLVRLGKKRDPKKLPNKIVPPMPTVKPKGVSYDAEADDKPNPKKKRRNRDAKISDKLRNSLDKAALFAKVQPDVEQEGDPRGVRGGTASKGSKGDIYMTRVADLWNRTWSLPAIISGDSAKKLYVLVIVRVDAKGKVQFPIKFTRKSGNDHFDGSVISAWKQIGTLPVPPADRLASVLANGLALKLTWRGMR